MSEIADGVLRDGVLRSVNDLGALRVTDSGARDVPPLALFGSKERMSIERPSVLPEPDVLPGERVEVRLDPARALLDGVV